MSRKTENGYYTVYTRQSKKVLEELENTGVYRVKEEYISCLLYTSPSPRDTR